MTEMEQLEKEIEVQLLKILKDSNPKIPHSDAGFKLLEEEVNKFLDKYPDYIDDTLKAFVEISSEELTVEEKQERKTPKLSVSIKRKFA